MADQVFLGSVFSNTDDDPILSGDVVVRDLTVNGGVKRTTTTGSALGVGIALTDAEPGHQVTVATFLGQRINFRVFNGDTIARGDHLVTGPTEGYCVVDNAASGGSVIGIAIAAKAAAGGTLVEGLLVARGIGDGGGGGGGSSDHKVAVHDVDTTADFLANKLQAGTNITFTTINPGANERLQIAAAAASSDHLVIVDGSDTTPTGLAAKLVAGAGVSLAILHVGGNEQVQITGVSDHLSIVHTGGVDTTPGPLISKIVAGTNITFTTINPGGNEQIQISAAGAVSDHLVIVHTGGVDTTPGALSAKLVAGTNITFTTINPGANEQIRISAAATSSDHLVVVHTGGVDTTPNDLINKLVAGTNITLTTVSPGGNEKIQINALAGTGDHKVLVDIADTTPGFLGAKIVAGTNITFTTLAVGGNEQIQITAAPSDHRVIVDVADTTPAFLGAKLVAGTNITLTTLAIGGNEQIQITAAATTSDHLVIVHTGGTDTTPGSLANKIVAGARITFTTVNPGGNEQISIAADVQPSDHLVIVHAAGVDTTPAALASKLVAGANITFTTINPGANEQISIAAAATTSDHLVVVHTGGTDTTPGPLVSKLVAGTNITFTTLNPGANEQISISAATANNVATWSGTRFFAVDPSGGNDANAGFSDVSLAAAFAVAKQTWVGVLAIIPHVGNNRDMVIGGKVGTLSDDLNFTGFIGYRDIHIVASTDASDNDTDRTRSGFVTDATATCAASSTTSSVLLTGTPLTVEPTHLLHRARFNGNVTGALTNACAGVYANNASGFFVTNLLSTAPAAGDTLTIERPGLIFPNILIRNIDCRTLALRGLRTGGTWDVSVIQAKDMFVTGCEATAGSSWTQILSLTQTATYTKLGGGSIVVGMGFCNSGGAMNMTDISALVGDCSGIVAASDTTSVWTHVHSFDWGSGCVLRNASEGQLQFYASGSVGRPNNILGGRFGNRNIALFAYLRIDKTSTPFIDCGVAFQGIRYTNTGAAHAFSSALAFFGLLTRRVSFSNVQVTNNAGWGISFLCHNGIFEFDGTTDLTGLLGAMRALTTDVLGNQIAPTVPFTFLDVNKTNFFDPNGNHYIGPPGRICARSGLAINDSGGTIAAGKAVYLKGNGDYNVGLSIATAQATCRCDGITQTTSANGEYCLVAIPGDRAYAEGAIDRGSNLFVDVNAGLISYLTPNVGNYKLRVGRGYTGTGSPTGQIWFVPEKLSGGSDGLQDV